MSLPSTGTELPGSPVVVDDLAPAAGAAGPPPAAPENRALWRLTLRRFCRHRLALAGLIWMVLVTIIAVLAPLISPYDPNTVSIADYRLPPSAEHWLGTDSGGRDVLSRLFAGSSVSLLVGLSGALAMTVIGGLVGLVAGLRGGWVDAVIMRIVDVFMSFPLVLVFIMIGVILGPSMGTIVFAVAAFMWPFPCRIVRQVALSTRERDYVLASRAIGSSGRFIMFRHLLPSVLAPLTVLATVATAAIIMLEAGLSFLGVGLPPPDATWGNMLQDARSLTGIRALPWVWMPAGVAISLTVLSINFIGDGLRDALDPRM